MNPRFPRMSSREVIRLLRDHGFEEVRQRGSHLVLCNDRTGQSTTVPVGKKDVPIGTLRAILKEAGIEGVGE